MNLGRILLFFVLIVCLPSQTKLFAGEHETTIEKELRRQSSDKMNPKIDKEIARKLSEQKQSNFTTEDAAAFVDTLVEQSGLPAITKELQEITQKMNNDMEKLRQDICAFNIQMHLLSPLERELIFKPHLAHLFRSKIRDLKAALEECKEAGNCCESPEVEKSYNILSETVKKWSQS